MNAHEKAGFIVSLKWPKNDLWFCFKFPSRRWQPKLAFGFSGHTNSLDERSRRGHGMSRLSNINNLLRRRAAKFDCGGLTIPIRLTYTLFATGKNIGHRKMSRSGFGDDHRWCMYGNIHIHSHIECMHLSKDRKGLSHYLRAKNYQSLCRVDICEIYRNFWHDWSYKHTYVQVQGSLTPLASVPNSPANELCKR